MVKTENMRGLIACAFAFVATGLFAREVSFVGEQVMIDGAPFLIRGGELHPQRVPREYWRHRVQMMKAMGLNTVSSYFFWNGFERADGSFDFATGNNDVVAFLKVCHSEGMKVLFRPGPYCCGEWDFGGLPTRMLAKKGYVIRSTKNAEYLAECERYLKAICGVARPYLWRSGGPIILTQVENEYGSWKSVHRTPDLVLWTKEVLRKEGFGPFYMADGAGEAFYRNLPYPDPEIAVGMDPGMDEKAWNLARLANPGVPVFSSETYPGWLRHWGDGNWRPTDITQTVQWYVDNRKSFCLYVAHGGTSFGFSAGANNAGGTRGYAPDLTSYDYGAPISEQGLATADYYRYRKILAVEAGGESNLPPVPRSIPARSVDAFTPEFHAPLTVNADRSFTSERCLHFEAFGQNQGIAIYETKVDAGDEAELKFERLADYAKVLLDGKCIATVDRCKGQQSCRVPKRDQGSVLTIIVEAMGHFNFGLGMEDDPKGISGDVVLGGVCLTSWTIRAKSLSEESVVNAKGQKRVDGAPGGHFRGSFRLDSVADTFIDMSKWSKGTVYVNGHNLGRYWKIGPQYSLYCPAPWLRTGTNRIDIIEMDVSKPQAIRGVAENVVTESGKYTKNANNEW